jgi:hypothetical protein
MVRDAKPSIGYQCLGALIDKGWIRNLTETNFDDLVERGLAMVSSKSMFVVSPESSSRVGDLRIASMLPQLFKLHGDFRYDRLQNTRDELQHVEALIERRLLDFLKEHGLIVIGYSGRDNSVLSMLEKAIADPSQFPDGLFWCCRSEAPRPRVERIIRCLADSGRTAAFVKIEGFDSLLYHMYQQTGIRCDPIDCIAQERFEKRRPFTITIGQGDSRRQIMTNALRISEYPTTAFSFDSDLDDWDDLQNLAQGKDIAVARYHQDVIALGNRAAIESTFQSHVTSEMRVFDITSDLMGKKVGAIYHLFYTVVNRWLQRCLRLGTQGKLFWDPTYVAQHAQYDVNEAWVYPAFAYDLDWRSNSLHLVLEPDIVLADNHGKLLNRAEHKAFINHVSSNRYNRQVYEDLMGWLNRLKGSASEILIGYPPHQDPPSARFVLDGSFELSARRGTK